MSGICYITGAGCHFNNDIFAPEKNDLVIAADGGYDFLKKNNIRTDIIIGDFDSVSEQNFDCDKKIIRLNPVKDETDTLCAIKTGIKNGYTEFHIFGGTGGRTDHTFANIQTLTWLSLNNIKGFLYSENEIMTVIHNNRFDFNESMKGYLSVFSLEKESYGVCEKGLKYNIENYTMKNDFPVGVSNEFTGNKSYVSVNDGTLLLIYPRI